MKNLIVNADDFGLTEGVNQAIIDGHRNGIITSTTLMANGMAFEQAVTASAANPALGVGVHLNLTQGRPICTASQIPSIVTPEGFHYPTPEVLARRILTRKVDLGHIEAELRNQIQKIVSAGVHVTHLDGHKHIHLLPPIFDVVLRLAREFGIQCVRCPIEPATSALGPLQSGRRGRLRMAKQYLLARALSSLAGWQREKVARAGLHCPDHFYGLSQTGFLDRELLERMILEVPAGTSEIMCHPGYMDDALLQTRTRLRTQRETELQALTEPRIRQLVNDLQINLISYGGLPGARGATPSKCDERVQEAI
jgi:hopanoid biosynthesis associated protein HpnK